MRLSAGSGAQVEEFDMDWLPPLTALRAFEAVGRFGVAGASRELNVTRAAILHQIRVLEADRGVVLFLGVLCFIVFLVEGSMMDWSAVLMIEQRHSGPAQAGFGFASFSVAMTLGRLIGDRVVAKFGRRPVVAVGALLAAAGIALATLVSIRAVSLLGYALVGLLSAGFLLLAARTAVALKSGTFFLRVPVPAQAGPAATTQAAVPAPRP